MNKQEWSKILDIAENFGDECKRAIEEVGREQFTVIQRRLIQQSGSHAEKTPVEWVRAMWRYHDALSDRTFTLGELDKVERWAFVLHCLQDQLTDQFQILSLASGVTGRDNPHVVGLGEDIAETARVADTAKKALEGAVKRFFAYVKETLSEDYDLAIDKYKTQIVNALGTFESDAGNLAARMRRKLVIVEELAKLATVDTSLPAAKQRSLTDIAKEIDKIEGELRLRVNRGEDSGAVFMTKMLDKYRRFAEENPQLFTWWCPECDWEGILLKRQPPEDSLVNALDMWWTWKCPACRNIIAFDRKHPQIDKVGKKLVVFNRRAWDLICKGDISLRAVAYFLETSPEWITWAAEIVYRMQVPGHVKKELEEYEQKSLEDYDEEEVQDDEDLYLEE